MAAKNTKGSEKGPKSCVFFTKNAYNCVKSCQNHYNYIFEANQVPHIWLKTRNKEIEKSEHILNNVLGDIYNNVSLSILRITKYIIYVF